MRKMRCFVALLLIFVACIGVAHAEWNEDVALIQQALKDLGHLHGEVDGIHGLRTSAAIRQLQEHYGLGATGELDEATLAALEDREIAQAIVHIAPKGERYHSSPECRGLAVAEETTSVGYLGIKDARTPCIWCYGHLEENKN